MDAYKKQLLAKIDQLAAQADQLPEGDQRQQLGHRSSPERRRYPAR